MLAQRLHAASTVSGGHLHRMHYAGAASRCIPGLPQPRHDMHSHHVLAHLQVQVGVVALHLRHHGDTLAQLKALQRAMQQPLSGPLLPGAHGNHAQQPMQRMEQAVVPRKIHVIESAVGNISM